MPVLTIQGKGRREKDAFVVLGEESLSPIREYLLARGCDGSSQPLFASLSDRNLGGPVTPRTVSKIVKDRLRAAGLDDAQLTAHSLRHTAVTFALMNGATAQQTQTMARHASIETTMLYAHNVDRLGCPAEQKASSFLDS